MPFPSSQIFGRDSTRGEIEDILRSLDRERKMQDTVANLIGATGFETFGRGKVHLDTWTHRKSCYNLHIPDGVAVDGKAGWLPTMKH